MPRCPSCDRWMGMTVKLCLPRKGGLELLIVTVYSILTACLSVCNAPPRIVTVLHEVVSPFEMRARARNAALEQIVAVWRLSQFESRAGRKKALN
jgi:hypothetical protein